MWWSFKLRCWLARVLLDSELYHTCREQGTQSGGGALGGRWARGLMAMTESEKKRQVMDFLQNGHSLG